jgi:hypothetical protein
MDTPNSAGSNNPETSSRPLPSSPSEEEIRIFTTEIIEEIKGLERAGLIKVVFRPDFPDDYLRAKISWIQKQ